MNRSRPLRVHVDVCHPAHVHLFKNVIGKLNRAGHETLVTSREKEVTTQLLDAYDIDHRPISTKGTSKLSLASEWILRELRALRTLRSFDPDVVLSHLNPVAVHAATVAGADAIIFNDDEAASDLIGWMSYPFTSVICTPLGFQDSLGPKQRHYDGLHELAYLHPNRFEPDPDLLRQYGIDPNEPYFVLRFVSWGAHHDIGQSGLSWAAKQELVEFLSERGTVYISLEGEASSDLDANEIPVPPEHIHHLLAFADLYAGDSQTMALEAAVLGTPSVRSNSLVSNTTLGHFATLETEYGLIRSITDEREAIATVRELVRDSNTSERWHDRRHRLLDDTIDVTEYMLEIIGEVSNVELHSEAEKRQTMQKVAND